MKICLDNIVYSLQKIGGISVYWGELTKRLLKENEDVYFVDNRKTLNLIRDNLDINENKIIGPRILLNKIDRFLDLPLRQFNEKFIFHSSYNRVSSNSNAIHVSTLHDFTHEHFFKGVRRSINSFQKGRAINRAKSIIAISENTKNDLLYFYPKIDPNTISVIYNGVSNGFYKIENKIEQEKKYILFVGSRHSYKNFQFAVDFLKVWTNYEFYVVGPKFEKSEIEMLRTIINRTTYFPLISEQQLNVLYNNASILLYPSSYEGFGIPIVEAMKAGLPFLALNKSSIPEVAGGAGILIDELNIDDFSNALIQIEANRSTYINLGLERSKLFSWEKCYTQTVDLYKSLF